LASTLFSPPVYVRRMVGILTSMAMVVGRSFVGGLRVQRRDDARLFAASGPAR
jgi:hypothetical protein